MRTIRRAAFARAFAATTLAAAALSLGPLACGPSSGAKGPPRPALAEQWYGRAQASFKSGDFEDAREGIKCALQAAPSDADVRLLAARIALSKLDYDEAIK